MSASLSRACLFAALTCAAACAPSHPAASVSPQGEEPAGAPVVVKTALAREEPWERTLRVTGELLAFDATTLAAKVPGRLASLSVDLGSRVTKGQLIASVETRDYELRVAAAQAALEAARALLGLPPQDGVDAADDVEPERTSIVREARAELDDARLERDRQAELLADGVTTQSVYDTAEARFRAAESRWQGALEEVANRQAALQERRAALALARAQLTDARITAPFDGAVAARLASPGDYLAVGAPLARLVRLDPVRVRLEVPERDAPALRVGQTVQVEVEALGRPVEGVLARIGPEIGAHNRILWVETELANPDGALRPGSFARAEIVLDPDAQTLVVPSDALVRFAGVDKVFAVEDGQALEKRVQVGRLAPSRVEILEGLVAGEAVVLSPGSLVSGARVEAARE